MSRLLESLIPEQLLKRPDGSQCPPPRLGDADFQGTVKFSFLDCPGEHKTRTMRLVPGHEIPIGRASSNPFKGMVALPATFYFDCPTMSREHAYLGLEAGKVFLVDKSSMHGTFINGTKLKPLIPYNLNNGDTVTFGSKVVRESTSHAPISVRVEVEANPIVSPARGSSCTYALELSSDEEEECEEVDNHSPVQPAKTVIPDTYADQPLPSSPDLASQSDAMGEDFTSDLASSANIWSDGVPGDELPTSPTMQSPVMQKADNVPRTPIPSSISAIIDQNLASLEERNDSSNSDTDPSPESPPLLSQEDSSPDVSAEEAESDEAHEQELLADYDRKIVIVESGNEGPALTSRSLKRKRTPERTADNEEELDSDEYDERADSVIGEMARPHNQSAKRIRTAQFPPDRYKRGLAIGALGGAVGGAIAMFGMLLTPLAASLAEGYID